MFNQLLCFKERQEGDDVLKMIASCRFELAMPGSEYNSRLNLRRGTSYWTFYFQMFVAASSFTSYQLDFAPFKMRVAFSEVCFQTLIMYFYLEQSFIFSQFCSRGKRRQHKWSHAFSDCIFVHTQGKFMALSIKYLQHSQHVCNSTANFHVIIYATQICFCSWLGRIVWCPMHSACPSHLKTLHSSECLL